MTHDEFISHIENSYKKAVEILKMKNADYATGEDPFANFRYATLVGVPVERAILVRMSDKLARISNVLKKGHTEVKDETIKDTLLDLANYSTILIAYLDSQK